MTRVDFYVLKHTKSNARLDFICRLADKVYNDGHRVLLHTDNEKQSGIVDDMLWTWRQGSFIPHEIQTEAATPDCPIVISHQSDLQTDLHDVLINMAADVPLFFSQFERVTEVVDQNEQTRQSARQRYRFYQDRGYPLESHDINQ